MNFEAFFSRSERSFIFPFFISPKSRLWSISIAINKAIDGGALKFTKIYLNSKFLFPRNSQQLGFGFQDNLHERWKSFPSIDHPGIKNGKIGLQGPSKALASFDLFFWNKSHSRPKMLRHFFAHYSWVPLGFAKVPCHLNLRTHFGRVISGKTKKQFLLHGHWVKKLIPKRFTWQNKIGFNQQ